MPRLLATPFRQGRPHSGSGRTTSSEERHGQPEQDERGHHDETERRAGEAGHDDVVGADEFLPFRAKRPGQERVGCEQARQGSAEEEPGRAEHKRRQQYSSQVLPRLSLADHYQCEDEAEHGPDATEAAAHLHDPAVVRGMSYRGISRLLDGGRVGLRVTSMSLLPLGLPYVSSRRCEYSP